MILLYCSSNQFQEERCDRVTKFCSFKFGELVHVQKHGGMDPHAGFSSCKE
jgi:hypothetical protein